MQIEEGVLKNKKNMDIPYRCAWPDREAPHPTAIIIPGFGDDHQNTDYIQRMQPHLAGIGYASVAFTPSAYFYRNGKINTGNLTYNNYKNDTKTVLKTVKEHPSVKKDKIVALGVSLGAHETMQLMARDEDEGIIQQAILYSLVPNLTKPFEKELTENKLIAWQLMQMMGHRYKCLVDTEIREFNFKMFKQARKLNLLEDAQHIDRPVTIINGTKARLVTPEDILGLSDRMTKCDRLSVNFINDAGHCFELEPKKNETISEFDWAIQLTKATLLQLEPELSPVEHAFKEEILPLCAAQNHKSERKFSTLYGFNI